jgi:hypothetical protein
MALSLLLSLAAAGAGCGDDAGDDAPAAADAAPPDATPPVDGDLVNDAGPLVVGDELSFAEDHPGDLPAYGAQDARRIGWVGSEYLALVVTDLRVVVQRVSAAGQAVGAPLELAHGPVPLRSADMACSAERCLVVWSDGDPASPTGELRGAIIGAGLEVTTPAPFALGSAEAFALAAAPGGFVLARRLEPDGLQLVHVTASGDIGPASTPFFTGTHPIDPLVLGCDSGGCVVTMYACPAEGGTCVRHMLLTDLDGNTAEPEGREVDELPNRLVSTGTQMAAIYESRPEGAQLVRLDGNRDPVGAPVVVADQDEVSGAFFDGVAYVVLGHDLDDSVPGPRGTTIYPHMKLTRVALDGTVLLDGVPVFAESARVQGTRGVAGCHDGDCVLLAAKSFGPLAFFDAVATRLHEGHALDPAGRLVTTATPAQVLAAIASNGEDFLVLFGQPAREGDELRARRIGADGHPRPGDSQVVAAGTSTAATALAAVDDGYLCAWVDAADGKLRLAPLDVDGAPSATPRVLASIDLESFHVTSVGLACHAGQCLVAWTDDHVHVQRVSGAGVPVDAAELELGPPVTLALLTVAYNRGQYAVGWLDHVAYQRDHLEVALVAEEGPLVAPVTTALEQEINDWGGPRLVPSTGGFLLVWEGIVSPIDPVNQLMLAELHADGTVGEIIATLGSSTDLPPASPEAIVNGQDVLVAGILPLGESGPDIESDGRLHVLRVGSGPRLLDPEIVDVGPIGFRDDLTLRGAASSRHDVLLVRDVVSNDPAHIGPHVVGRLLHW